MFEISLILLVLLILVIVAIIFKKKIYECFGSDSNSNSNSNEKISLLIFVSETCHHCVNYNKMTHPELVSWANKKGYELKRIFAHDDKEKLFDKYNIEFVPACVIIKDSQIKSLSGPINSTNIENAIKTI